MIKYMYWSLATNSIKKITCMVVDRMTKENGQHTLCVCGPGVSTLNELCLVVAAVTGKHDTAFQESRKRPGILFGILSLEEEFDC